MKAFLVRSAFLCAMAFSCVGAWAQGAVAATIEFSSGDDIVVIRSGKRLPFKDSIGLELLQGDQVQTGKGVFVEIRLGTGSTILKLAENTTFLLERLESGQTSLQLVYGRMRAKVEKLAGTDSFSVRSPQAVAGVRGTDFGLDVIASRSVVAAATMTRAYCFEGSVEIVVYVRSTAQAAESLEAIPRSYIIGAGEMVKIEGDPGKSDAVKQPLEESIRSFWKANDYKSEEDEALPDAAASTSGAAVDSGKAALDAGASFEQGFARGYDAARLEFGRDPGIAQDGFLSRSEADAIRAAARLQAGGIVAGSLISTIAAGSAVYGFFLLDAGDTDGGVLALRASAIMSATAIPFLVMSLFAKP
ncbi:MAG: hypothetical protein CVV51_07245 [Spirochaetae bacterium HGW-Spirochaetae-7]|jgi:hypothetical protein|nr:MAG: hypothetical protein CVV51_07245 [Spirochaetae bacterium HGW-Spirochaetae-7]